MREIHERLPYPPRSVTVEYEDGEKRVFDCQGAESFVFLSTKEGITNGDLATCVSMLQAGMQLVIEHLQRREEEVSH